MVRTIPIAETDNNTKFEWAEDVKQVAKKLIENYHGHLVEAKIAYLFRHGNWNSKGKVVFGKAQKVPDEWKYLTGYDLRVVVNKDVWDKLTPEQREALVDHELCHFTKDEDGEGNPNWSIEEHDIQEFSQVVQRHGLWRKEVENFFTAAKQMSFEDFNKKEGLDYDDTR